MSDSLKPHGLQHTKLPCTWLTPGTCSNSWPSSWWFHPTISSSVIPFSSCLQSFLASGSFQMSQFFASGGQSIGVSASASVSLMNIQDWFPLGWTGLILAFQGTLKSLLQHHSSKASILRCSTFFIVQLSHPYMTTGKTIALTRWIFIDKATSLLLICCLGWYSFSSKEHVSFNFMAAVTICSDFGDQENKVCHYFHCFPIYLPEMMGSDSLILVFWMLGFKPTFSLSSFTFIKRFL